MIPRKLVEAVFRRWWVVALPVVLAPILVVMLTRKEPEYQSTSTVWVARPDSIDGGTLGRASNPYITAAQAQTQVMYDLLSTRSFRQTVAANAGLGAESELLVAKHVSVSAIGVSLISIQATTPSPEMAQRLVTAVTQEYLTRAVAESQRQTEIAITYFTAQLALAKDELDIRRADLSGYLATHPTAPDSKTDLTYPRLLDSVASQTQIVDGLNTDLQTAQRTLLTANQGVEAAFTVQDEARLPLAPVPVSITKRLGYPVVGLGFGLALAACYLYLVFRSDHSIRSSEDLVGLPVQLLAYVPELNGSRGFLGKLNPIAWLTRARRSDYARAVAASISTMPAQDGTAS